jgi:hypothetical protein
MRDLTVGDGFRFGCGFFLAGLAYSLVMMVVMVAFMVMIGGSLAAMMGAAAAGMAP